MSIRKLTNYKNSGLYIIKVTRHKLKELNNLFQYLLQNNTKSNSDLRPSAIVYIKRGSDDILKQDDLKDLMRSMREAHVNTKPVRASFSQIIISPVGLVRPEDTEEIINISNPILGHLEIAKTTCAFVVHSKSGSSQTHWHIIPSIVAHNGKPHGLRKIWFD